MSISRRLAAQVQRRALNRCEYCHLPQTEYHFSFEIAHVIAEQHGGKATVTNLALAYLKCNKHKGPNLAGIDPETRAVTRLFNPRQDLWEEHFRWRGRGSLDARKWDARPSWFWL